jgi:type IV pilus assembly protein PilE
MKRDTARRDRHRVRGAPGRGHTLVEALVTLVIMSILASFGVPKLQLSLERSRANVAGASLRSIWSAQRLYWLENRYYAPDLTTLHGADLIDQSLVSGSAYYTYSVTATSWDSAGNVTGFTVTAERTGASYWNGQFFIDTYGNLTGQIELSGQGTIIDTTSFQ